MSATKIPIGAATPLPVRECVFCSSQLNYKKYFFESTPLLVARAVFYRFFSNLYNSDLFHLLALC